MCKAGTSKQTNTFAMPNGSNSECSYISSLCGYCIHRCVQNSASSAARGVSFSHASFRPDCESIYKNLCQRSHLPVQNISHCSLECGNRVRMPPMFHLAVCKIDHLVRWVLFHMHQTFCQNVDMHDAVLTCHVCMCLCVSCFFLFF